MTSPEELLSRPQRNDLFRALEKSGAPVSDFTLQARRGNLDGVYIYHFASKSHFLMQGRGTYGISGILVNGDPSMTAIEGSPAFRATLGLLPPGAESEPKPLGMAGLRANELPWDQVVPLVEKWAQAVIAGFREYEAIPDLWAELQQSRQLLTAPSDNTPFSEDEQAEISRSMQQVRTFVSTVPELTPDQLAEVNERLDEMEEASRRVGRKDWLLMFSGAVFGLILTDTITPTVAQRIIMLGLQGLGHLFGIGGPPVPLP